MTDPTPVDSVVPASPPISDAPISPPRIADGLNPRQRAFVDAYLIDPNATQAAITAGYSVKTARVIGQENLLKPAIRRVVEAEHAARIVKAGVSVQWVLDRLVENHARAMQAEEVTLRDGTGTGQYVYQGAVANKALELIGKHVEFFPPDRHEHDLRTPNGPIVVNIVRESKKRTK